MPPPRATSPQNLENLEVAELRKKWSEMDEHASKSTVHVQKQVR